MKIITTQTIEISEENEVFVDLIIQEAGGFISDTETKQQAIHRILAVPFNSMSRNIIQNFVYKYFGIAGKQNADALMQLIDNGALSTVTTIE
jgi:hypothetical protein